MRATHSDPVHNKTFLLERRDANACPGVFLFPAEYFDTICEYTDIHEQLRTLLDGEGLSYRVIEHEPERRTEVMARIRGNKVQQSIKSMVLQVRRKENMYCLANVPGDCRVDLDDVRNHFHADSAAFGKREKAEELTDVDVSLHVLRGLSEGCKGLAKWPKQQQKKGFNSYQGSS